MNRTLLARIGAGAFIAFMLVTTVIVMTQDEEAPVIRTSPSSSPVADPLRAELRRCRDLGEAGFNDAECRILWMKNRDRFLGRGR